MAPADAPAPPDAGDTGSRASSLWPDTGRLRGAAGSSLFNATRFDPLHGQATQARHRLGLQFHLCQPALALRVLLAVQAAVLLAGAPWAQGWVDAASRAAVGAFAGLSGTLLWLPAVCGLRPWLAARPTLLRDGLLMALGGLAALAAWVLCAGLGLVAGGLASAAGSVLAGAALAGGVWHWLGLRALAAQPVEASARLAELQSRIRPHFLFNALNTALALVQVDPQRAEAVLEDLAQLFRVALAEPGASVSLEEEVDLARRYLAIEEVRFGPRLAVQWHIDPRVHAARIPPLVLQPLVENAVRHGVEPALAGGRVVISTRAHRGMAIVMVTNTLPETPGPAGNGIALANVAERLRLLHDVAATLHCGVEHGLYNARIEVPL